MTANNKCCLHNIQCPNDLLFPPFNLICNASYYFHDHQSDPMVLSIEHICSATYYFEVDFPGDTTSIFEVLKTAQYEIDEFGINVVLKLGYDAQYQTACIYVNATTVAAMVFAYRAVDRLVNEAEERAAHHHASSAL